MTRRLILLAVLALAGCGGNPVTPTNTGPDPVVRLQLASVWSWVNCGTFGCAFRGEIQNTGTGCATNVNGTVRLFDSVATPLVDLPWTLGTLTLRPGTSATFQTGVVGPSDMRVTNRASTTPNFRMIAC